MQQRQAITECLAELSSWRHGFALQTARVAAFMRDHGFLMRHTEVAFDEMAERIDRERLTVVFIGEAGGGKSTLVNALFFGESRLPAMPVGHRLSARCVTEILYDRRRPTGIQLLPIESRESPLSFEEIYRDPSYWQTVRFDPDDTDSIRRALVALSEVRRIPITNAVAWGHREKPDDDGMIEVPRWRHAIVNLPHPLLDAGLAIVDTPGAFSPQFEPEMLRGRLADADVMIFVVDASLGLTLASLTVWRDCLGDARDLRLRPDTDDDTLRLIALNKIDLLRRNDPLDPDSADRDWLRDIGELAGKTADALRIEPREVVPVSAQMALVGKAAGSVNDLVVKSRLYQLERMLDGLTPLKRAGRRALGESAIALLAQSLDAVQQSLDQTRYESLDALRLLAEVRKKNEILSAALAKESGERSLMVGQALTELQTVTPIHQKLAAELAALTDPAIAQQAIDAYRRAIETSKLTGDVSAIVADYFADVRQRVAAIGQKVEEATQLFTSIGGKLFSSVGLSAYEPHPFGLQRFDAEIARTEEAVRTALARPSRLLIRRTASLAQQFDTLATERVLHLFAVAHRESTTWMRGLLAGIEKPILDLNARMQSRAEKIAHAQAAELELAEKLAEIQARLDIVKRQHTALADVREGLERFAGKPVEAT